MYLSRRPRLSVLAAALIAAPFVLNSTPATALAGADAPARLNYVAKINVGEQSACTGTLIDPQWVLTAATCFAADGKPPAGKPAITTTVTIGRTDLTQTSGSVLSAVRLVPHADRDLVLVKLAARITDPSITPVRLATTPAAAGEELVSAGFGRTKTEWVPDKLHTGTFTVASTTDTTVDLNGSDTATVCKGDMRRSRPAHRQRRHGTRRRQLPLLAGRMSRNGSRRDSYRRRRHPCRRHRRVGRARHLPQPGRRHR